MRAAEATTLSHCQSGAVAPVRLFHDLLTIPRVAIAVSGGSDSMALLRLLLPWRSVQAPTLKITVLTVDHALRTGSRAEAERVAMWCGDLGVDHVLLTWEGPRPLSGVQAKARTARYDLMTSWCVANDVAVLLTAHTLNDQAETVVMRKRRTASAKSLAGIWPETVWNGVRVLRPLLQMTRCDLRTGLRQQGQGWLDDPSNDNVNFERVRIRRSLRQCDIAGLAAEAEMARRQSQETYGLARQWLKDHAVVHPTGMVRLSRAAMRAETEAVQCEIFGWAIAACGGGQRPERASVVRLAAMASSADGFRRSLGGALVAGRVREIMLGREPGRMAARSVMIPPEGTILWDGRFLLTAPVGALVRMAGSLRPARANDLPDFVPAFVIAGLPVIEIAAEEPFFPHFAHVFGVSVTLGERFLL